VNRTVSSEELAVMRGLLSEKIPSMNGPLVESTTCIYTMTPDEHFLIDFHPDYSTNKEVVIASPCSGHGFKFGSVIGEILSQLAVEGNTRHNIDLFRIAARKPSAKL
jgi:sarcosine oxidase